MAEIITIDEPFPVDISYGSTSILQYNTDVVTVSSGVETRNSNWVQNRNVYNAAFGIRSQIYLNQLIEFFHVAKGKKEVFLYKDWIDYSSLGKNAVQGDLITKDDQPLGIGDDTTTEFQLIKRYIYGKYTDREINKPVGTGLGDSTVLIANDGILQIENTHYTVDYDTGIVTFASAPLLDTGGGSPAVLTAGFEYWVPCRFDTDTLSINLEMYEHGSTDVPIIEVRV